LSELPAVKRLRQIADEIGSLPDSLKCPSEVAPHGAVLLKEAVFKLGAFDGVEFADLRVFLDRPPRMLEGVPTSSVAAECCQQDRLTAAWDAVVGFLFSDWHYRTTELGRLQSWLDACEPIAGRLRGETPPADDENGDCTNRYDKLDKLSPAVRKAYLSYLYAEAKAEKRLEDRDAHEWLHENAIDGEGERFGVLDEYELPAFDSWSRYLRRARKALGEKKYTSRHAKATTRSIVQSDEI